MSRALAISGGGCKGAFAVGVLKFLFTNRTDIDFQFYAGTSTGALILPLAILNEIPLLANIYGNSFTNDIIKKQPVDIASKKGYLYDAAPLKALVENTISDDIFSRIMDSDKEFFISTVCMQTGKVTYFTNSNKIFSNDDYDVETITGRGHMIDAIRASAHQPVFMEPINMAGRQYVDGGVREYLPIRAALDAGADDIFSIILSSKREVAVNKTFTGLIGITKRTVDLFSEDVGVSDYIIAKLKGGDKVKDPIRPDEQLAENGLDFNPDNMRISLQNGVDKASQYDWDTGIA